MDSKKSVQYFVYFVICADQTIYTGVTTDLERRVKEHNSGEKGAAYTKVRRPVVLGYCEALENRSNAQKREYYLRNLSRKDKLALIDDYKKAS